MRDLSHYPIGIVPSHVWRRPATPAPRSHATAADQIPPPESERVVAEPERKRSEGDPVGVGREAAATVRTPAPAIGHPTGTPPPSVLRPEVAAGYAALFRLVREVRNCWRECPSGQCRRHRRCVSHKFECEHFNRRPCTPEQEAAIMAETRRHIERRLAELRARGEA